MSIPVRTSQSNLYLVISFPLLYYKASLVSFLSCNYLHKIHYMRAAEYLVPGMIGLGSFALGLVLTLVGVWCFRKMYGEEEGGLRSKSGGEQVPVPARQGSQQRSSRVIGRDPRGVRAAVIAAAQRSLGERERDAGERIEAVEAFTGQQRRSARSMGQKAAQPSAGADKKGRIHAETGEQGAEKQEQEGSEELKETREQEERGARWSKGAAKKPPESNEDLESE